MALIDTLGFDGLDAGSLEDSWRQQPGTPVYCTDFDVEGVRLGLTQADRPRAHEIRELMVEQLRRLPPDATPADLVLLRRRLWLPSAT
jgi:8-hydroxy-5-deazaflavin:NADPH oxidoreductase